MLDEQDFTDFKCPYCGETVSFPQADVGFVRACPNCIEDVIVPKPGEEAGAALPIPITTARLILRRLAPGDSQDLLQFMPDEDAVIAWLERDSHVRLTTPDQTFWLGIELREGGKLVGYLGLRFTDAERRQAMLTATLNDEARQAKLGLEALDAQLGFCFEGIKLHRVTAVCDKRNEADCHLFENVGMRREGEFVKDTWADGEWRTSVSFAALDEEWASTAEQN